MNSLYCRVCGELSLPVFLGLEQICNSCWREICDRHRDELEFNMNPPVSEEFVGVSNEEKHATIEARRDTVLAECNSKLPTYKPV